ncbi:phosphate ABC transporter permease subunit PstC [Stakelama sediminis]|uniref:Phosphate transport system permease protein n=2 Tax=Stakelama sediminis TaxID=463200 RepID=A0A840YYV9_9SPHN|nr:phosphate ABC transporter permease subunit PstC [Stakelama sediminis]MBB5718710.1 phosphate transport system permease protein [Stakelama sediminis]
MFRIACASAATLLLASLAGLMVSLVIGGWPALSTFGFSFLTSSVWNPVTDVYGAAGPISGTLITAFLSLIIALPLALGIALFLVEFCPPMLSRPIAMAVELLAGIPSIVYGMWGLFVFAPWFAQHIQLPLMMHAQDGSWLASLVAGVPNGANIFTASVILAVMILPYMAAVFRELFLTVPPHLREAAYGLGCTPYETVRAVLIPYVRRGMIGVIMLGLGRALGETMAVTFIIGNAHGFPHSLFASGSTLASTIANEFAEATGAMHGSALMALGLVLFCITFAVLGIARMLIGDQRA